MVKLRSEKASGIKFADAVEVLEGTTGVSQ